MYDLFLEQLAAVPATPDMANPYRQPHCRARLRWYLERMAGLQPLVLLVGEAAGYRGCARTGIPFTSEAILAAEPFFQAGGGPPEPPAGKPLREATATMVWSTLAELPQLPLLWNAFPFHPHQQGDRTSNRQPRADELAAGEPFLRSIITFFEPEVIAAAGRQAEKELRRLGVRHIPLRHPSHGGKAMFAAGLSRIFYSLDR